MALSVPRWPCERCSVALSVRLLKATIGLLHPYLPRIVAAQEARDDRLAAMRKADEDLPVYLLRVSTNRTADCVRPLGEAGGVALERASPITVTICDHYTRTRYQQEFKISF
jgi:hypothetical protein